MYAIIYPHVVDLYGFHVGKYPSPMDPSWVFASPQFSLTGSQKDASASEH